MVFTDNIDLHMHSTISDGTDEPEALLALVQQAGLDIFALTDHDAIEGCRKIRAALKDRKSPVFINGAEFSCKDGLGKYHILGYGYDPEGEAINALVKKAHAIRMEKLTQRLDFLKSAFSIVFSEEEVEELMYLSNPGKPHIAKLMIRHGIVDTIPDAMRLYLNKKKFQNAYVLPEQAISAILSDGGIPVLAHPPFGDGDQMILGADMETRLKHLLEYGLQGVECFYSGFTPKLSEEMLHFADRFDLFVTAGSDYHGSNKLVRLKDNGFASNAYGAQRVRQFLEAVL